MVIDKKSKQVEVESPPDNKSYQDKVDLNDLDWEDRERVLRLLFSKMNAGVHPSTHHIQKVGPVALYNKS